MFAVLKTGGKQYKVQAGDVLRVELLAATAGEKVQFNDILMLGGEKAVLGAPLVAGAAVQAGDGRLMTPRSCAAPLRSALKLRRIGARARWRGLRASVSQPLTGF